MRIERRILNPTSLYKRSCPKLLNQSNVQSPTGVSLSLKLRNPSIPRSTTAQSFALRSQRQHKHIEIPCTETNTSSKEKSLISKIITLKKERNELNSTLQKQDAIYKKKMEKLQLENTSMKNIIKKIIPYLDNVVSPKSKIKIQRILEMHGGIITTDSEVQCCLILPENESDSNKVSTGPHSETAHNNSPSINNLKEDINKLKEDADENKRLKTYVGFAITRKETVRKVVHKNRKVQKQTQGCSVFPNFIKSLCISN